MLSNASVAQLLTEQLNSYGKAKGYSFEIFPDANQFLKEPIIQGILVATSSDGAPIALSEGSEFISRRYSYYITFAIADQMLGTRTKEFNASVAKMISNTQGQAFPLSGGQAIFTFEVPKCNGAVWIEGGGEGVIESLFFNVIYTQNATTTSDKVWLLDGKAIPYLSESIELEKQGATNSIYGLNASQSLPIKQTKYYHFTLPYVSNNVVCSQLQKDMLNGDMTKVYTLSYYDGISYTKEEPFTSSVSLYRTGESGAERPSVSNFTVIFTDVDNGQTGAIRYEMALIDNQFSEGIMDVRWFADLQEQQAWYEDKILQGAPYSAIRAPNLNSLTITQQVYINASSLDLRDLLTKNYAVIKATEREGGKLLGYYYYYVQSANAGGNNQILVDLKMDSVQTYYFKPDIEIADCVVQRAHLNRFIPTAQPGIVAFDGSASSQLFEREDIQNVSKRLTKRTKILPRYDTTDNSEFNQWLYDNVYCWVYAYTAQVQDGYHFSSVKGTAYRRNMLFHTQLSGLSGGSELYKNPFSCVCYPIYKSNKRIKVLPRFWTDGMYTIDNSGFDTFMSANGGESILYQIKFSSLAPFNSDKYSKRNSPASEAYNIVNGDLFLYSGEVANKTLFDTWGNINPGANKEKDTGKYVGVFTVFIQDLSSDNLSSNTIDIPYPITFAPVEMKGLKNVRFNPKLLSSDYSSLIVTNDNQQFEYDIQKINNRNPEFRYTEVFSPDITRQYVTYRPPNNNGVYIQETTQNLTGLVGMCDNSIPYSKNQLEVFLANNKNFFLQRNVSTVNQLFGSLSSALTGNGGASKAVSGILSAGVERIQSNLSLDNMRNAPEMLSNANGNALMMGGITELSIYAEIYQGLESELKIVNDYMFMNGFAYNKIDKIKNLDNIRKYFNFIQADIQSINGISISNSARNDIRARFANGIRFWNNDTIQYDRENYEKWLE